GLTKRVETSKSRLVTSSMKPAQPLKARLVKAPTTSRLPHCAAAPSCPLRIGTTDSLPSHRLPDLLLTPLLSPPTSERVKRPRQRNRGGGDIIVRLPRQDQTVRGCAFRCLSI